MDKEESFKYLFTALKVALKNASFYHTEHPAFKKAVEDLKGGIDNLLNYVDPIKIGFTPSAVFFDNKYWEEDRTYKDIARAFHFRKVKSLEIRRGLTIQDLTSFIANSHLAPKDIFKAGGLQKIIKEKGIFHLAVEELDYSQLLKGEGEEVKNVWTYLLDDAIEKQNQQQLDQVAETFEKIAGQLDDKDFSENEELPANINKLMSYMKKAKEERFHACAKVLVKAFMKNKKFTQGSKLEKLRVVFADIGEEDFASALWEEIATDSSFDALSFSIFSKLTERDKQEKIASKLNEEAKKEDSIGSSPELRKKIKDLLSGTSSPYISEIYRETLASLLQNIQVKKELLLNRTLLSGNYRYLLLNLLEEEADKERKRSLLAHILEDWEEIKASGDFEYLKNLAVALKGKDDGFSSDTLVIKTNKLIADYVEKVVLSGQSSLYLDFFLETMEQSTVGVNAYLQRIFSDQKVTPSILHYFFKFFSDSILYFFINLEEKSSDNKFLDRLTESLKMIDSPLSLDVLKAIYSQGNNYVKIKVLRAMQSLSSYDENFLFPILQKGSYPLKKEALVNLIRHDRSRAKALDTLFSISSPFGIRNKIIRKHIQIVDEVALDAARGHVFVLSQKRDIWHRRLRKQAKKVLEKLDGRKN
jgi:hypothetical protein